MKEKLRISVLASDKGIDLQAVIDAIQKGELIAKISVVISDKQDAYVLERANNYNIPAVYVDPNKNKTREDLDKEIIKVIEDHNGTDLILLIGYMRILTSAFIQRYKNKIMNIHPSLLPTFAGGMGTKVHKDVIDSGMKVTGCTLHFVDEGIDTGPIILQKAVNVEITDDNLNDTVDSLEKKVNIAEQDIILEGIRLFAENRLKVEGKKVRIIS